MHEQLHAYVDGELDLVHSLEVEKHLQGCPACAGACNRIRELSAALRAGLPRPTLPPDLRARVRAAVRGSKQKRQPFLVRQATSWVGVAAALALLALGLWAIGRARSGTTPHEQLVAEVIASHVRSQMLESHLLDVESSDRHEVKPWFQGKLDFSPFVIDLAKDGFVLSGGRLDYVNCRAVAALVYRRRQHAINLLVWPAEEKDVQASTTSETKQGYHVVHWRRGGMEWWAVSDLNADELLDFARRIQERE
jgi:anti-sigma factor RsiW